MDAHALNANRRLRIFAFDPGLGRKLETRAISEIIVSIPMEMDNIAQDASIPFLGPVGEYLEVLDEDPASDLVYSPVNLNDSSLLSSDGLVPDEASPQFHQQMVYAIAMTTIVNFERALGRRALWSSRLERDGSGRVKKNKFTDSYVGRLRIYPHALREANAFYSPEKKALLFGYFQADDSHADVVPGSTIFTCLSHDVIAHETTHALLDGMHRRYSESSNSDALALHEAFADIVAIFQHFSYPEVLHHQIAKTKGNLETTNLLGQLAQEFGQALGRGGALRDALGGVKDGVWQRHKPDRNLLQTKKGAHSRGAILVAAVFQAFVNIYNSRTQDMFRIATNGTGILPPGAIHPDLVNRLSQEAAKTARHVLQMCIRAFDYCPPVDVTFGDYLRAIITADNDLYPEDPRYYRVAIVEAFIAWGIVPEGLRTYSPNTLLWPTLQELVADQNGRNSDADEELAADFAIWFSDPSQMMETALSSRQEIDPDGIIGNLRNRAIRISELMNISMEKKISSGFSKDSSAKRWQRLQTHFNEGRKQKYSAESILSQNLLQLGLDGNREVLWHAQKFYCEYFWGLLTDPQYERLLKTVGIDVSPHAPRTVFRSNRTDRPSVEVHSVRSAKRRGPRDQMENEYVVEVIQRRRGYFDSHEQTRKDSGELPIEKNDDGDFRFRRGCTLLIDAKTFRIRRVIRTPGDVSDDKELSRMRQFLTQKWSEPETAFDGGGSPSVRGAFAHLHRHIQGE